MLEKTLETNNTLLAEQNRLLGALVEALSNSDTFRSDPVAAPAEKPEPKKAKPKQAAESAPAEAPTQQAGPDKTAVQTALVAAAKVHGSAAAKKILNDYDASHINELYSRDFAAVIKACAALDGGAA